jgi:hypothetical protein
VEALRSADRSFNAQTALVLRAAGETGAFLRIRLVDTFAVPALPQGSIDAVLRMPDGTDRVATVVRLGDGELAARLDLPPIASPEAMFLRLVPHGAQAALPNPVADYAWTSTEPPRAAARPAAPAARRAAYWMLRLFMGEKAQHSLLDRPTAGMRASDS